MNNLPVCAYTFENTEIRTLTDGRDGSVWFVLRDVLDAMLRKGSRANEAKSSIEDGLGEGHVKTVPLQTAGGLQEITVINEPAVTFLISRSNTEAGKKLNRWIHTEVLPAVRKTGGYQLHLNKPDPALYLEQAQHLLRREVQMFKQHALTELDSNLYTFRSVAKYVNEYGKCSRKLNDSSVRSMAVNAGWLTPCHTYVRNKGEYFIRLDMLPTTGRKSASRTLKLTWLGREVLTSEYAYAEPLDAEKQLRQYLSRVHSAVDGIPGVTRKEVIDHLILEWKQAERNTLSFAAEPLQQLARHLSGTKLLLN